MSNNNSRRSSIMEHQPHHNHNYNHSSFSSSLLEEIYRSFDEDNRQNCSVMSYRKIMNKSTSCYLEREKKYEREDRFHVTNDNYNDCFVLDQWIDKSDNYNCNKVNFRRISVAEVNSVQKLMNSSSSSSSSSDSSSGIGGFSSSESESLYGSSKTKVKPKNLTLKPIRTSLNPPETYRKIYSDDVPAKKKSIHGCKEGNFQRRALKLYGDLKKVKQPISPGGKLARFLNSLFNSTSSKKPKISSPLPFGDKYSTSTPSTASSYSRSCLSKTPSSAGRFERRSVRFCPVNTVISDTDTDYHNHNYIHNERNVVRKGSDNDNKELKVKIMEKHRRVEVAKELLKNYHHGRKYNQNDVVNMMNKSSNNNNSTNDNSKIRRFEVEDDVEVEDDDISCSSSDLFELENLLDIGVDGRYDEELPVYETTHVDTNRAIANGFIL